MNEKQEINLYNYLDSMPEYPEIRESAFISKRGRSYNEEDMFNFLEFINNRYYGSFSIDKEDLQDWFEQFKNK